ncbi:MAG: hypothetical protein R3Y29_07840 [bacterium]
MQTNKSDFYKKTYASKIDTSSIKTTRSNSKNLDYSNYKNSKKIDVYSDKTGIYEVDTPNTKKSSNLVNKVVFLMCLVGVGVYLNSVGYLNTSSTSNIITSVSDTIGSSIQSTLNFLSNTTSISIPSFNVSTTNSEVSSNSDLIKIDDDIITSINQDISSLNNSNFTQQSDISRLENDDDSDDDTSSSSIKN